MGRLCIKVAKYKYKEIDRRLKEQFITDMNNEAITGKIIKESRDPKDTSDVSSEHILIWAKRVETQTAQNAVLENIEMQRTLTQ